MKTSLARVRAIAVTAVATFALTAWTLRGVGAEQKQPQLLATVNVVTLRDGWTLWSTTAQQLHDEEGTYAKIIAKVMEDGSTPDAAPPIESAVYQAWVPLEEKAALNLAAMTDDDKHKMSEYESQAHSAKSHLIDLENKATPTDADKTEIAELRQKQANIFQLLTQKQQEYRTKVDTDTGQAQQRLDGTLQDAINKIAQEQNITYVLNAQAVLFPSDKTMDITDQVLKRLNKR